MGHEAEDVAAFGEDAGDVLQGAVGIGGGGDVAGGGAIAKGDAVVIAEVCEGGVIAEVVTFHVSDGHLEDGAARDGVGERGICALGAEVDLLADVALIAIAHEGAREEAGFAEDLKAVADTQDEAAGCGELRDGLHDGGELGDGAGAEVVAIGEAARDEDGVAVLEIVRGVPEIGDGGAELAGEDVMRVVVAVGAGEDEDAELHRKRVAETIR